MPEVGSVSRARQATSSAGDAGVRDGQPDQVARTGGQVEGAELPPAHAPEHEPSGHRALEATPPVGHGRRVSRTFATRLADARLSARLVMVPPTICSGEIRNCVSPTAATNSPTVIAASPFDGPAAIRPAISATRARKPPMTNTPAVFAIASTDAARRLARSDSRLARRYRSAAACFGAEALQHPQAAHQVGGHRRRLGRLLLFVGPPVEQLVGEVLLDGQHRREAGQDQQPEPGVDGEEEGQGHDDRRAGADRPGEVIAEAADLLGVGVGDAHELAGLEPALDPARGGQRPADEAEAGVVLGALAGPLGENGVGEPGRRQHGEKGPEEHQPADQRPGIARPDGPVDHRSDHDRHERFGDLVDDEQGGAGKQVPALAGNGLTHHGARRGSPHAPPPSH